MNSRSTFYHPVLEKPDEEIPFDAFWKNLIQKFQQMTKTLKEKYDTYLCTKGNPRHTVHSLGIRKGQQIWIRIFAFSPRLAYLSSLLPRFKAAKVIEITGKTSLILEDLETGKMISRALVDCYPIKPSGNFSNLFVNSKQAIQQDGEEDFGGLTEKQIPGVCLDATGVDRIKQEERDEEKGPTKEEVAQWSERLRKRDTKMNYKE